MSTGCRSWDQVQISPGCSIVNASNSSTARTQTLNCRRTGTNAVRRHSLLRSWTSWNLQSTQTMIHLKICVYLCRCGLRNSKHQVNCCTSNRKESSNLKSLMRTRRGGLLFRRVRGLKGGLKGRPSHFYITRAIWPKKDSKYTNMKGVPVFPVFPWQGRRWGANGAWLETEKLKVKQALRS